MLFIQFSSAKLSLQTSDVTTGRLDLRWILKRSNLVVELHLVVSSHGILQFLAQILVCESLNFSHLHTLSVFIEITSDNKLRFNRQLLCGEAKSLLSNIETDTLYFKEDTSWGNRCNPSCGITLTLTHTHISRLTGDGLIREDTNPDLTLTIHITVHGHTGSLDLTAVKPLCLKGLDAERSKRELRSSVGITLIAAAILWSSIFYSFWL